MFVYVLVSQALAVRSGNRTYRSQLRLWCLMITRFARLVIALSIFDYRHHAMIASPRILTIPVHLHQYPRHYNTQCLLSSPLAPVAWSSPYNTAAVHWIIIRFCYYRSISVHVSHVNSTFCTRVFSTLHPPHLPLRREVFLRCNSPSEAESNNFLTT